MEVSLESRLILAAKAARPKSAETENTGAPETAPAEPRPDTDTLSLTQQSVEELAEQSQRLKNLLEQPVEEPVQPFPDFFGLDEEETGSSELDAMEEGLKTMQKCQEIARRIMRGDKVPPEDERYLMENDPDGFKLALAMRTPKKHPKEWESVLKDEKKAESSENSGGESAAPDASCEASGGTSESGTPDTGGGTE